MRGESSEGRQRRDDDSKEQNKGSGDKDTCTRQSNDARAMMSIVCVPLWSPLATAESNTMQLQQLLLLHFDYCNICY